MDTHAMLIVAWLIGAVVCGVLGAAVGRAKNAQAEGLGFGLLFGPIGILITCLRDNRPQCPTCLGRIDAPASACQHCGQALKWYRGIPWALGPGMSVPSKTPPHAK